MTQRYDIVQAKDYMEFLTSTTHLYKNLLQELNSRILEYNEVLETIPNNTNLYEQLEVTIKNTQGLIQSTKDRIEVQEHEYKRLEYYMLHGCLSTGLHPELSVSFFDWNLNKMKLQVTFH
jgi:hypothetical protein